MESFDLDFLTILMGHIGRGVRSGVQLVLTETRIQKYSQSGKNGSKHPMLSISMAYNVISCKGHSGDFGNERHLVT